MQSGLTASPGGAAAAAAAMQPEAGTAEGGPAGPGLTRPGNSAEGTGSVCGCTDPGCHCGHGVAAHKGEGCAAQATPQAAG